MRVGASTVSRGREFDALAQNKSVLAAVAGDAALPAERLLPDSAAVLPDDVSAALVRTADLCRPSLRWRSLRRPGLRRLSLRRSGLLRSDGAAGSVCGCARGSLSLTRDAGRTRANLTESLAVR